MAKRTKKIKTTTTRTTSGGNRFSLNKFAFWLIIIIGIAMAVSGFFHFFDWDWVNKFSAWVQSICFALAMFIPIVLSYRAACNKSTAWFILWIIFVVLVAFGVVANLVGLLKVF